VESEDHINSLLSLKISRGVLLEEALVAVQTAARHSNIKAPGTPGFQWGVSFSSLSLSLSSLLAFIFSTLPTPGLE
jgi:hypothetical protein